MKGLEAVLALMEKGLSVDQILALANISVSQPEAKPKEEPNEEPKEEPKEEVTLADLQKGYLELQKNMATLTSAIQANAIMNSRMPEASQKSVTDVIAEIIDPKGVTE